MERDVAVGSIIDYAVASAALRRGGKMGYVLRVRLASFFAGAATASFLGLYFLHRDYKIAHESISHQIKGIHGSLDSRISALEKINRDEASQHVQATE